MMGIKSAKIVCDGTVQNLGQTLGASAQAIWYQLLAGDPAAQIFLGGADLDPGTTSPFVPSSNGFPLVSGAGQLYPRNNAEPFNCYEAKSVFFTGAVGDVLYVLYPV